jgi:hypothetical protein
MLSGVGAMHKVITTDAELDRALDRAKLLHENRVVSATYNAELHKLVLQLADGQLVALPVNDIKWLQGTAADALSRIEILGNGTGLRWPDLDLDLYIPALLQGAK